MSATVWIEPADRVEFLVGEADEPRWPDYSSFVGHVDRFGYGRGTELLLAAARRFWDLGRELSFTPPAGFQIGYRTTIPRQVGLAGSSAVIIGALRCLCEQSGVELPAEVLATVAWEAETEELGVSAGLQDRVVQAFGSPMVMDFAELTPAPGYGLAVGAYESVDLAELPPLFVAYRPDSAASSGEYHRWLRAAFEGGDRQVRETLRHLAGLVIEGRAALRWGATEQFGGLVAENMRLRRSLGPIPDAQLLLVDVASEIEVPVTFAGSGGAVIGVYGDAEELNDIRRVYADIDAKVVVVT